MCARRRNFEFETAQRPGNVSTPLSSFFPRATFGSRATLVPIDLTVEQPEPTVAMQTDLDEVDVPMHPVPGEESDDNFFDEDEVEQIPFDGDLDGAKSRQVKAALDSAQQQYREVSAQERSETRAALRKASGNATALNRG